MSEQEMRDWIDKAGYEALLRRWRNASSGDPIFQGEIGQYYSEVMAKKQNEDPEAAVGASKRIGW